jgi:hypothetical protein
MQDSSELGQSSEQGSTWARMIKEMEQEVVKIRQNLKAAQDRQKSYADLKRVHKEFQIGDHVYLESETKEEFLEVGELCQVITKILWAI